MPDRERSHTNSAVAKGGITARDVALELPVRSHRTTIVPQPLDESDSATTRQQPSLRSLGELRMELDEPDLFDSELDEPTRIKHESPVKPEPDQHNRPTRDELSTSAPGREAQQTGEITKPSKRRNETVTLPKPNLPPPSILPKADALAKQPSKPPSMTPSMPPPTTYVRPLLQAPPLKAPASLKPPARTASKAAPPEATTALATTPAGPPSDATELSDSDPDRPEKWYLRVQLNTDCVADLWVRDLTPHNVLVWSDEMEAWVPLLTVRELRDAIREAHDLKTRDQLRESNFVFLNTSDSAAHQPPPRPRLQAAMTTAPLGSPTSNWSQPKSRTISNVPPPLLTTSVPVMGAVRQQSHFGASGSTAPPIVTSIGHSRDEHLENSLLPAIPRPSRVPSAESVLPYSRRMLAPDMPIEVPVEEIDDSAVESLESVPQQQPPRLLLANNLQYQGQTQALARVPAPGALAAASRRLAAAPIPLVHIERGLWLAAGVAVAVATMLVMRSESSRDSSSIIEATRNVARDSGAVAYAATPRPAQNQPTTDSNDRSTRKSDSRSGDVHRAEDLPVVGAANITSSAAWVSQGSSTTSASSPVSSTPSKGATHVTKGGRVEPMALTLATTTPRSGAATGESKASSSGGFDTGAARRVLGSAAARAGRCAADGPASGSVIITFAPSGFVQNASMSGLSGKGVNAGCVLRAFQEARVSPFSGAAVTVRKGFQIL